jgi:hypothetical protein
LKALLASLKATLRVKKLFNLNQMRLSFSKSAIIALVALAASITGAAKAQVPGAWTAHYSYNMVRQLTESKSSVYCLVENAIFSVKKSTGEISTLTTVNSLSAGGASAIAYCNEINALVIGYSDGNLEIHFANEIVVMPQIKQNKIFTNKQINHIRIENQYAYISTGFGIIAANLSGREFTGTYLLSREGEEVEVYQTATGRDNNIYAATGRGIFFASYNSNSLADPRTWLPLQHSGALPSGSIARSIASNGDWVYAVLFSGNREDYETEVIKIKNGASESFKRQPDLAGFVTASGGMLLLSERHKLFAYDENETLRFEELFDKGGLSSNTHALVDDNGEIWLTSYLVGAANLSKKTVYIPNGPLSDNISDITPMGKEEMICAFAPLQGLQTEGYSLYSSNNWLNSLLWDKRSPVAIIPDNQNIDGFYCGVLDGGLLKFSDFYNIENSWDASNSTLDEYHTYTSVRDIAQDAQGNVWAANGNTQKLLKAATPDGKWYAFAESLQPKFPLKIGVTSSNRIMATIQGNNKLLLYDYNKTLDNPADDKHIYIGTQGGEEQDFAIEILAIAEDHDNALWIGTNNGIAFMPNEAGALENENPQFRRIKVDERGAIEYMFDGMSITTITIDAGNRKWLGTSDNGAYLVSAEGNEIIRHFTAENSPLPSNYIRTIGIRPKDGEVFFGTAKGMVSYRGDAKEAYKTIENITVIPNPVKPGYTGDIAIYGLVNETIIKITDLSGRLVYETVSNGGMAIWPGTDMKGRRPQTGVYFIFASDPEGSQTGIGKLVFIN